MEGIRIVVFAVSLLSINLISSTSLLLAHLLSTMSSLLQPVTLGHTIELRNRICMGAMTRNRCVNDNKPTDAAVKHYADRERDGAGLIVSEGIFICPTGSEYLHPPVMWDQSHAQAWKKVTTAVHQEGGKIFFQAWHAGRWFLPCYSFPRLIRPSQAVANMIKCQCSKKRIILS